MKLEDIKIGEIYIIRNSKAEVLAIKNQKVVYWDIADDVSGDIHVSDVYIKTPEQKLMEDTIDMAIRINCKENPCDFLDNLYDAGMLIKPRKKINFGRFCYIYYAINDPTSVYEALKPYMNTED